jgi:NO-binding membrane sensor protein with MHYT domain
MNETYINLVATYDISLVLLSYVISAFGAYTALQLVGHVLEKQQKNRMTWIVGAAIALGGGGIWSMHFIAMLAYKLPIAVGYDMTITISSMIAAIVVTGIGLYIVTGTARENLGLVRLCAAGTFVGVGVGTMHYIGMDAMRMNAELNYDPMIFGLSFVVAIVVATVGLFLLVTMQGGMQRVVSSLVIAFAVSGMHYTAMYGTTCQVASDAPTQNIVVGLSPLFLGVCIAGATMAILIASQLMSFLEMLRETEVRN